MNRTIVGKKTPVWYNKNKHEVAIGRTIEEALGVGIGCPSFVTAGWEKVNILPREDRVVLDKEAHGACYALPNNQWNRAVATQALQSGALNVTIGTRAIQVEVLYQDATRVIIKSLVN